MDLKVKWIITILVLSLLTLSFSISAYILSPIPKDADVNDDLENSEQDLELFVHVLYDENFAKPDGTPGGGNGGGGGKPDKGGPSCYDFIGKGVYWKDSLPLELRINPGPLSEVFALNAVSTGAEEWDGNTNTELFSTYTIDYSANLDTQTTDGRNELSFGNYDAGVIAVTYTWGYYSGPPSARKIVEFDILFNTDFSWGDGEANPALMDYQNIFTHEVGHGLGLGDVYESDCSDVTMYGYSYSGDIEKRSLEAPDITGLQELYGGL